MTDNFLRSSLHFSPVGNLINNNSKLVCLQVCQFLQINVENQIFIMLASKYEIQDFIFLYVALTFSAKYEMNGQKLD